MKNYTSRREAPEAPAKQKPPQNFTFFIICCIILIWGAVVSGLVLLQAVSGRAGNNPSNNRGATSVVSGAENQLSVRFTDENGLTNEANREVIALAAEVVRLVEERGFRISEVIVPRGQLREFNLIMERAVAVDDPNDPEASAAVAIRIRCSTTRLAAATAADVIQVYDLWLDGEIAAAQYIDIRTSRRAFYQ